MAEPLMAELLPESEVEAKVIEAIAEQLGVAKDEVTRESEFDKICDSLDKAELMMEFEDLFEISITDEAATKIGTVADAIGYIRQALGGAADGGNPGSDTPGSDTPGSTTPGSTTPGSSDPTA